MEIVAVKYQDITEKYPSYSTYIAAQFYPTYYTLIPSAVLVGLAGAPLWSAKCTYVSHVGKR